MRFLLFPAHLIVSVPPFLGQPHHELQCILMVTYVDELVVKY